MSIVQVFISYCHQDISIIEPLRAYLKPLESSMNISIYWDCDNNPGSKFMGQIDAKLKSFDIFLPCLSDNFFESPACQKEVEFAFSKQQEEFVYIIPIIINPCKWLSFDCYSSILAIPTDGKPIGDFSHTDDAHKDIVFNLRKVLNEIENISNIAITDSFNKSLNDMGVLSTAWQRNPGRALIEIDDLFVYQKLMNTEDHEKPDYISSQEIPSKLRTIKKIIISGDSQSGKTTLCKKLFYDLRAKGYIPILLSAESTENYKGIVYNKLPEIITSQYRNLDYPIQQNLVPRVVMIMDDFHLASNSKNFIKQIEDYSFQIFMVDDLFILDKKDFYLASNYYLYSIRQLSATGRNQLVKKWLTLNSLKNDDPDYYKKNDNLNELIESSLGKIIGYGIMPSYPFYILTILMNMEGSKPLDPKITSQGYCYQILILNLLSNSGVPYDEIDTYLNFLSLLAFEFFNNSKFAHA